MEIKKAAGEHGNNRLLVTTNKTTMNTKNLSEKGPEISSWEQTDEAAKCIALKDLLNELDNLDRPVFLMVHGGQTIQPFTELLLKLTEELHVEREAFSQVSVVLSAPPNNLAMDPTDWEKINNDKMQTLASKIGFQYEGRKFLKEGNGENTKSQFMISFSQAAANQGYHIGHEPLSLPCWMV
jgi:hypothetical protein